MLISGGERGSTVPAKIDKAHDLRSYSWNMARRFPGRHCIESSAFGNGHTGAHTQISTFALFPQGTSPRVKEVGGM